MSIKSEKNRKFYRYCSNNFAADCKYLGGGGVTSTPDNFKANKTRFKQLWVSITKKRLKLSH